MKKRKLDPKLQAWIDARKRHRLSHAHVQMARELGMNPKKLGKIDNHKQQPWKAPLPEFISFLYEKRFGRRRPENVLSIEALARKRARQADARRRAKAERRLARRSDEGLQLTAKQAMEAQSHE
jgi:SOS-response transcriptional repressor LexA